MQFTYDYNRNKEQNEPILAINKAKTKGHLPLVSLAFVT